MRPRSPTTPSKSPRCSAKLTQELTRLEPALRRFVQALQKNPHDVDDVVQETLLRALRREHRADSPTRLTAWLFLTARNVHVDLLRRSSRQCVHLTDELASRVPEIANGCTPEFRELQSHVGRLVEQLQVVDREIAGLMLANHPPRTIASIVGLKQGTVRSKICRTRRVLRTELRNLGLWSPRKARGRL